MDYFSKHIFSDLEKKTLDYSLWFLQNFDETMTSPTLTSAKINISIPAKKDIYLVQQEQNDANFSFIAFSSEELWVRKET